MFRVAVEIPIDAFLFRLLFATSPHTLLRYRWRTRLLPFAYKDDFPTFIAKKLGVDSWRMGFEVA